MEILVAILKILLGVGLGIVLGVIALIIASAFETKPAPPNTDYRQANIDYYTGKISAKEMDRRVMSGYYVKKDKEN